MKKIAIVDDNDLLRKNIINRLENDYSIFLETDNGKDLIEALENAVSADLPDMILMDIEMDEMDGITATAIVKGICPEVKVVMLSVFEQDEKVWQSIIAGADGYILKDEPREKLLNSLEDVLNEGSYMSPVIARKVINILQEKNQSKPRENFSTLSKREVEILQEVATGKSYKQIAADIFVSVSTVKTHINHIYKKLQVTNKIEALNRLKEHQGFRS